MKRNVSHYELLQVHESASQEIIHAAWKFLAQKYHPDNLETGNIRTAQAVNAAYQVLKDPEKRARYDAELKAQRRPVEVRARRPQAYPDPYPGLSLDLDGLVATFTANFVGNLDLREAFASGSEAMLAKLAEDNPALAEAIRVTKQARRRTG